VLVYYTNIILNARSTKHKNQFRRLCEYISCRWFSESVRSGLSGNRIPVGQRFSVIVPNVSASHPPSCIMVTGYFSGLKPTARGDDHTLPSEAEVVNGLELHLRLPSVAAWTCHGVIFIFTWVFLTVQCI
jgi:hypothetical protein